MIDYMIGERIKELRTLADMSQEELGRRVGVQRAAINKYEKGTVTNVPIATIEKIANVFNVSPIYIVGWEENNSNPLATEVKIIQAVSNVFGSDIVELMELYVDMNKVGQRRVQTYTEDMWKLYQTK